MKVEKEEALVVHTAHIVRVTLIPLAEKGQMKKEMMVQEPQTNKKTSQMRQFLLLVKLINQLVDFQIHRLDRKAKILLVMLGIQIKIRTILGQAFLTIKVTLLSGQHIILLLLEQEIILRLSEQEITARLSEQQIILVLETRSEMNSLLHKTAMLLKEAFLLGCL